MQSTYPTNRHSRRFAMVLGVALTTTVLSGCVGGTAPSTGDGIPLGDKATLNIVSQFGDNAALQPVLEEISDLWEADHPEVTVNIQYLTMDDEKKTLPTSLASGSGPDIFDYDAAEGALGVLAISGLVRPMDEYAEKYGWFDRLSDSVVARTTYDDTFYAVPRASEAVGIFYNASMFEAQGIEAPTTYDAFLSAADALKSAGVTPIAFGNKDQWPSSHLVGAAIHATVPVDDIVSIESIEGSGTYSGADVTEALQTALGWVNSGYVTPNFNGVSADDAFKSFVTGEAGMFIEGSGYTPDIIDSMGDNDIRFIPFPMINSALARQAEGGVGGSWAISSSSKAPAIAADWINFVHFSDQAEKLWLEAGVLPTTDYSTDGTDIAPLLQENVDVVQAASDGGGIGRWTGYTSSPLVTDAWNSGAQEFLDGQIDATQFAASLDDALTEARSSSK